MGKCHICGQELLVDKFEADQVKSHSSGGSSIVDNYLPAYKTCNNYRWHYLSEELQWILILGVQLRFQNRIPANRISVNTNVMVKTTGYFLLSIVSILLEMLFIQEF